MESKKRAIEFQNNNTKRMIIPFWVGIITYNVFAYILYWYRFSKMDRVTLEHRGMLSVAPANVLPIILILGLYSYKSYYERFPVALSFNVTRKDFYKSLVVDNVLVASKFALIQGMILKIDPILVNLMGGSSISDFMIFNTMLDNIFFVISSIFLITLTSLSIMNLVSLLSYKSGNAAWIGALVFYVVISEQSKGLGFGMLYSIRNMLNIRMNLSQVLKLGITMTICYGLGYIVIKKTNIKYKAG